MTLIGVIVRAAAVALMTATLLLPIADHHAIDRLPEVALQVGHADADLHSFFVHHHARPHRGVGAPIVSRDVGAPAVAPAVPLPSGEGVIAPQAAAAPTPFLPPLTGAWSAAARGAMPTSLLEPPPVRPPIGAA